MSTIPSNLGRVATTTGTSLMLSHLRRTNVELLRTNAQISSGLRVNRPSDDPTAVAGIVNLRSLLAKFDEKLSTLERAGGIVDVTDAGLAEVSNLLGDAHAIASSQIGVGSSAETRLAQAEVIDAMIDGLFDIANQSYQGVYLFGGRSSSTQPFVEGFGGVRYAGSREDLLADPASVLPIQLNTNGDAALGALSTRVRGTVDLNPDATATTRIADVSGARGAGVTLGVVRVTVNGTPTDVDLAGAATLGDVADRINDVIGAAGSLAVTANGFTLTAGGADTVTIADVGTGLTTGDLGIALAASGGSSVGGDVDAKLTLLSDLSQLGVAVDLAGGLKITNGTNTSVIDVSAATTVQELINTVNGSGLGVRMEINAAGTGLNLVNEVSGTQLSIGENAGGTTATDFGLRSFAGDTDLADFNYGTGVRISEGVVDMRIELHDGTQVDVNLDGATTVQDVLDAINTAAGASGLTASLAADGNGIVLDDATAGAGAFRVLSMNGSYAAQDLGLLKTAGAGATLAGDDVATVRSESVFTHLVMLRDALKSNDERMVTIAAEALNEDVKRVSTVRAQVGVRGQRIAQETERTELRQIQTQSLLSDLRDVDYTEAISRFTQLQQQLEATLATSSKVLQLSLLDFLR